MNLTKPNDLSHLLVIVVIGFLLNSHGSLKILVSCFSSQEKKFLVPRVSASEIEKKKKGKMQAHEEFRSIASLHPSSPIFLTRFHKCSHYCSFKKIFNWKVVALQYCAGFCHTTM